MQKLKAELENLQHNSHTIALSRDTILPKNADVLQKILTTAKLGGPSYKTVYFIKLYMCLYLRTKLIPVTLLPLNLKTKP